MIAQTAEIYVKTLTHKQHLTYTTLSQVVEDCLQGNESAMKKFYEHFQGFALSVCLSYSENRDDALEIMNDGFLKVFKNLDKVNTDSIKPWMRRILINGAIDHYRKNSKWKKTEFSDNTIEPNFGDDSVFAKLSAEDIMKAVQNLPSIYRMVFNLYVVEGFSHKEIGEKLGIVESTSRAHLSNANSLLRQKLKKMI